jgi:transitional endoplasmic reticulum ATPase
MDGLKQLKGVVVIGTTNRINSLDTALRREGRFSHEIHIGVPDVVGRKEILEIHTRRMPLAQDFNLDIIAEKTVGFVGADIASLCREAAYNALRRYFPEEDFEKGKVSLREDLKVSQLDFDNALPKVPPSAMKEFLVEIPKVSWEDIGGLGEIKKLLIENIAYAITKREVFKKIGVKPARGILLYGSPGTGKTLLAKAVAHQCGANFIAIKGPEIRSKWFGESEERIRFIFSKAREVAPCVIFFDEIDAVVPRRGGGMGDYGSATTDTIVNQILAEMDGIESAEGIFIIGATNRPGLLDPAILRPGRFDYHIEVPLPDRDARRAIFSVHLKEKPLAGNVNVEELIKITEGFSGADIAELCRESIWEAIRDAGFEAEKVSLRMEHFTKILERLQHNKDKLKPRRIGFLKEDEEAG